MEGGSRGEDPTGTRGDSRGGPSCQNPSQAFDLTLSVTVQVDGNLIVQLLDGSVQAAHELSRGHLVVVEHSLQVILQPRQFLVETLRQYVDFVLQLRPRRALSLDLCVSRSLEGLLELRAGRLEQILLVLDIGFRGQARPCQFKIIRQDAPDGLHYRDGLFIGESAFPEIPHQSICVEMVDVRRRR